MNAVLMEKCDLLAQNRLAIREAFMWDSDAMSLAGSAFYVGMNKTADPAKMKECEKILAQQTGILSQFRGNVKVPVLCKMAVSEDPAKYLEDIRGIVGIIQQMKQVKWSSEGYQILAAMTIYDHTEPAGYEEAVVKMTDLYHGMKEDHPWLTSGEDVPFAAMLAVSGPDTDALLTEVEACYQGLKDTFYDRNALQALSHVLAVDKAPADEKCRRVKEIYDLLKEKKHKFGMGTELAVLGALGMSDISCEAAAEEIIEADEYLKTQKGFGNFTMGEAYRRMYAALMVMNAHAPAGAFGCESALSGALSMVIAMEICMIMIMTSMSISVAAHH